MSSSRKFGKLVRFGAGIGVAVLVLNGAAADASPSGGEAASGSEKPRNTTAIAAAAPSPVSPSVSSTTASSTPPALAASAAPATRAAAEYGIWSESVIPKTASHSDTAKVKLGVKFRSSTAGYVKGIQFYRAADNTGPHVGELYSTDGTRLASVSFPATTTTGWVTARFATPVSIAAGKSYIASYTAPRGRYAGDHYALSPTRPAVNGALTATQSVYVYGTGMPWQTYRDSNYYVDVVYAPNTAVTSTTAPTTTTSTTTPPTSKACFLPGDGACGPYSYSKITNSNGYNTYANNQLWGCGSPGSCGPQSMTAWGAGRWEVISTQRAGNTGVLTYPNTQQLLNNWNGNGWNGPGPHTDTPVSALAKLESSYSESMNENAGTIAQAAYDIWTSAGEIMIWTDTTELRGSGGAARIDSGTIDGEPFTYYVYGGSLPIIKFDRNRRSATVDILEALNWLIQKGHIPANTTIGQVNFGFEICSTGGVAEKFEMLDYSLTAVPR